MNASTEAPVSVPIADLESDSPIGDFPEGRRLVGTRCMACGTAMIGSRVVCSTCVSEDVERIALPDTGNLYTFTRVHVGTDSVRPIGYVDLDGVGVRTLTDLDESGKPLAPDTRVQLVVDGDAWYFASITGT